MNLDQKKLISVFKLMDSLNPVCWTTLVTYKFCWIYKFFLIFPPLFISNCFQFYFTTVDK